MNIIVCGGRDFDDYSLLKEKIFEVLDFLRPDYWNKKEDIVIISGAAKGADSYAEYFANVNNIKKKIIKANWNKYGKSAGYRRNKEMLDYALKTDKDNFCIAFWDEKSKGTKMMVDLCKKTNVRVKIIKY